MFFRPTIFSCLLLFSLWLSAQQEGLRLRIVAESNYSPFLQSKSNEVTATYPMQLEIPTAFSPNGDGLNDTYGLNPRGVEKFELVVYNRLGEILFRTTDPSHRWDGSHRGQPLETGVYAYELKAISTSRQSLSRKGTITLIN